ncbi:MAG: hypothetical protein ABIQ12_13240 [Opitutaceae bacterium]
MIPDLPSEVWLQESGMPIADFGEWLARVKIRFAITCKELRLGT